MRTPIVVAILLALVSLGGLVVPDAYARETAAWTAQAIGQDWFDLVIAAPWLVVCGVMARRRPTWKAILAGAYAYTIYELFIYAFGVHFNALFLLYCATLGSASFALIALIGEVPAQRGGKLAGGFLVGIGAVFGLLWLAEDVPALLHRTAPASLDETGLFTNPVHVIDLSFVLPLHVAIGISAWRGGALGTRYAPVVLSFGALMAASIGGMLVVMRGPGPVIAMMFVAATASALVLIRATLATWRPNAMPSVSR
ncbi:MAG TPA: hypothetical protein VL463_21085 [Kofleriaceae bacterium]|nr:hypothetical protein [Kofleriaceae bacterium]